MNARINGTRLKSALINPPPVVPDPCLSAASFCRLLVGMQFGQGAGYV